MRRYIITAMALIGSYLFLRWVYDAPQWGALVGSWVFWLMIRPKGWT